MDSGEEVEIKGTNELSPLLVSFFPGAWEQVAPNSGRDVTGIKN